jgi:hypothetical protein
MAERRKPRSIKVDDAMWLDWQAQASARGMSVAALIMERVNGRRGDAPVCRDCKWCRYPGVATSACTHDLASLRPVNLVSGEDDPALIYCAAMRFQPGAPCGVDGRLFEGRAG